MPIECTINDNEITIKKITNSLKTMKSIKNLMIMCVSNVTASVYSQTAKIDLNPTNATL